MSADILLVLDGVRFVIAAILAAIGVAFVLGGAIGLLRFPDFYTRLHAAGVANAVGAVIVVAALALAAWDWRIMIRLALLGLLIAMLAPTVSQLLANAAHSAGLAPLAGPYVAPRPGAAKREDQAS